MYDGRRTLLTECTQKQNKIYRDSTIRDDVQCRRPTEPVYSCLLRGAPVCYSINPRGMGDRVLLAAGTPVNQLAGWRAFISSETHRSVYPSLSRAGCRLRPSISAMNVVYFCACIRILYDQLQLQSSLVKASFPVRAATSSSFIVAVVLKAFEMSLN